MLIMSCYSTLGSLTCEEDGNLSTRDLGIIYRPKDGLVVNLYIPHNRRTPLQAEEALGPISMHRGSRGVVYIYIYNINKFKSNNIFKKLYIYSDMNKFLYINHHIIYLYIMHFLLCIYTTMCISIPFICVLS